MRKISDKSLNNVALHYLRGHSASRKGLVQLLERRVKRQEDVGPAEGKALVEEVVARMVKAGYIDDARMGEAKTASLHRQGKSSRVIQLKLREKGIDPELAKKLSTSTPEREFEAACTLVKRKRLGVDPERKQKDLAVLLRAGFNSDLARRALKAASEEHASIQAAAQAEADEEAEFEREEAGLGGQVLHLPFAARGSETLPGDACRVLQLPLPPAPPPQLMKKKATAPERGPEAAAKLVQKKRLGVDPGRKQKDLGVLVRAGFSFDVAKRALLQATVPT